jgi:hypothetical protein
VRKKATQPPTAEQQLTALWKMRRFKGVQIHRCGCRASARYAGRIFSFKKAPSLPVEGCDAEECHCEYLGITDRRSGFDRRAATLDFDGERKLSRRKGVDRRRGMDVWKGFDR